MKIKEIIDVLEAAAPLCLQAGFDNSGLLVGEESVDVAGALLCVDVTESVVEEAVALGAGIIISHHPLIFHPLRRLTESTYIERAVAKALRHNIAIYACHTNLDSAPGGMSHRLGEMLGLRNVSLLSPTVSPIEGSGYGVVGDLEHPMATEQFLAMVKEKLSVGCIRYSAITRPQTSRVALCAGSGASSAVLARNAGADVYLAADFKYNDFLDADRDLVVADIGHFESEYCAVDLIYEIIRKKISTFALYKSVDSINPVNYLA